MSDSFVDAYWAAPAMARTSATVVFIIGVLSRLNLFSIASFIYFPEYLWGFPPQIWRPITCFFVPGANIGLIFDSYFIYHYMSQLEVGHTRFSRKADLVWYLMCVSFFILSIDYFLAFKFGIYLRGLILSMAYTLTQDQRGQKSNFIFFTIPAQWLPLSMIFFSLLMPGGYMTALLEVEGLVAAHLYDFLSRIWPEFGGGPNILATPNWVVKLVRPPRIAVRGFGTAIRPQEQSSGSSTGASRGPLPDSWKTRGRGHRLG